MTADETLTAEPVQNRRQLRSFIKFPWEIYKGNPLWAPPLIQEELRHFNPAKNPFYDHSDVQLLLARRHRRTLGRIAVFVNRNHNLFHHDRTGFFGFFECSPDFPTARLLFDTAAEWLRERGMSTMRGPMNFSTNEICGFLLRGFDKPPLTMMPFSPEYYLHFAEEYGFRKARDLYAYLIAKPPLDLAKFERIVSIMKRDQLTVRHIDMRKWREETRKIKEMYNASWSQNWGFVPMTDAEFDHLADRIKPILNPQFVVMAEAGDQLVGFAISLPDINPALKKANGRLFPFGWFRFLSALKKPKQARVILLAVRPEFRNRGVASLLITETAGAIIGAGYTAAELSWTLEDNLMINKPIERIGGQRYKEYRIYEIPI